MKFSFLCLSFIKDSIYTANYEFDKYYENMTIQIYWKKSTTKKWKFFDKNSDIFFYFCPKYRLWVPVRTAIGEAVLTSTHGLFLSRNKKNNVYPVNPIFTIYVGLKGTKLK